MFYDDRIMAGGASPHFYNLNYTGDIYAQIPSSSTSIYSAVYQETPLKVKICCSKHELWKYIFAPYTYQLILPINYTLTLWGKTFSSIASRPALGPTQYPVQWVWELSWNKTSRGVFLQRHFIAQHRNYNTKCWTSCFTVCPFVLTTLARMSSCPYWLTTGFCEHTPFVLASAGFCPLSCLVLSWLLSAPLHQLRLL